MDHNFDTELFINETEARLATWGSSDEAVTRWNSQDTGEVCVKSVSSFWDENIEGNKQIRYGINVLFIVHILHNMKLLLNL